MHASFCRKRQFIRLTLFGTLLCLAPGLSCLAEDRPLHQKIDALLAADSVGPVASAADDLTFIRRVCLDLIGRIPSIAETRAYLAEPAESRRTALVDRLLGSDEFTSHIATVFDVMLMERRGGKHVSSPEFRQWLRTSFEQDKPFHQLAAELMAADVPNKGKASAAFFLERDAEPNLLTREISRMFFGRDVQCAQCHDHPNVDDYKQEDYYGVFAFVNRSSLFQPDKKKPPVLAESADGQSSFKSVFTDRSAFTSPRMPGEPEFVEPAFAAGSDYKVRGTKTVAAVPAYSRRHKLAELVASGQNEYFRRNIANRLWALVMGRGLVHPVDMHHSSNPPSNPKLMNLLATEIAALNFNVKTFLRELVLTEVYRRQHRIEQPPVSAPERIANAIAELDKIQREATAVSEAKAAEADKALEQLDAVIALAEPVRAAWAKSRGAATAAAQKHFAATTVENAKQSAFDQKQTQAKAIHEILESVGRANALLGESAELTATAGTLKGRADKLDTEAKKLQTELDAASKAAAAAADVLAKANAAEAAERGKLNPLQESLRRHRTRLVVALREQQTALEQVTSADKRRSFLSSITKHANAVRDLPPTKAAMAAAEKQQADAEVVAETENTKVVALTSDMSTAETARKDMETQMSTLTTQLAQHQKAGDQLSEAEQHLTTAAQLIGDVKLTSAAATLRESNARASQNVKQVESARAEAAQQLAELTQRVADLSNRLAVVRKLRDAARTTAADAEKKKNELRQQLAELEITLNDTSKVLNDGATNAFHQVPIESLTPEQLAWSILQASGQRDRQFAADLAKLTKEKPLTDAQKSDPAAVAQREKEAWAAARVTLEKQVAVFVKLFGAESGQPQDAFFATVDQALFFANGSQIRGWLTPIGDNLTGRLLKAETNSQLAEDLYLSTLVRMPAADEIKDVEQYLAARGDQKKEAVQELAWALITSAEFRFQY